MLELVVQATCAVLFFIVVFVVEIRAGNKREKRAKELTAKEKPLKIIEHRRISFGYNDERFVRSVATKGWAVICDILLFQNRMVIVAKSTLEIEMKDINFVEIRKVMLDEFLQICYNETSENGTTREKAIFLLGIDDNMLYIKNFIEERMNRPQIIDLT